MYNLNMLGKLRQFCFHPIPGFGGPDFAG